MAIEIEISADFSFRYEVGVRESSSGVYLEFEQAFIGHLDDSKFKMCSRSDTVKTSDWQVCELKPIFLSQCSKEKGDVRDWESTETTFFKDPEEEPNPLQRKSVSMFHGSNRTAIETLEYVYDFPSFWQKHTGIESEEKPPPRGGTGRVMSAIHEIRQGSIQFTQLDGRQLKKASPLNGSDSLRLSADGGNLPWVVKSLRKRDIASFQEWIKHLQTSLDDLVDVDTRHREDDRHEYIVVEYAGGVKVPSWSMSDGTLRMMALTLLAYLPDEHPMAYLIEEPENGIHPMAVETVFDSLSSVYLSQVFVATHSLMFLRCADPSVVTCFARSEHGTTAIEGNHHPFLTDWQSAVDNDLFFTIDILN